MPVRCDTHRAATAPRLDSRHDRSGQSRYRVREISDVDSRHDRPGGLAGESGRSEAGEHPSELADGLADALLVLDQGEPDVTVAAGPEADAG